MKTIEIKPTQVIRPFSDAPVQIRLFGRNSGSTDWSIANLLQPSDTIYTRINDASPVNQLYAPRPSTFNAEVCRHNELTKRIQGSVNLSNEEMTLSPMRGVCLARGVNADGCDVPKGTGFWLSSADCYTIVVWGYRTETLICAHAGLNCLVDRKRLETGREHRVYGSVVHTIMNGMAEAGESPESVMVFMTCGIRPAHFRLPPADPKNALVINWVRTLHPSCNPGNPTDGCLDLIEISKRQFALRNVKREQISDDGNDTYTDKSEHREHLWWSHERAVAEKSGEELKRNGVMVLHEA